MKKTLSTMEKEILHESMSGAFDFCNIIWNQKKLNRTYNECTNGNLKFFNSFTGYGEAFVLFVDIRNSTQIIC